MSDKPGLAGCGALLALGAVGLGGVWVYQKFTDPFWGKIEQYREIKAQRSISAPYLHGKVLIVDDDQGSSRELEKTFAGDLRPQRPEEVGTVVRVWRHYLETGDYRVVGGPHAGESAGSGGTVCYDVDIIDLSFQAIIDSRKFCGGDPPKTATERFPLGSDPINAVKNYLLSLPRK